MKIGILQTHAIGDIIISLPIAQYFVSKGAEVYWPIDQRYIESFSRATSDQIRFLPVNPLEVPFLSLDYFINYPLKLIEPYRCDNIYALYSALGKEGKNIINQKYFQSLKFDEYKYALTGVPFSEKWNLSLQRDPQRESTLLNKINPKKNYVLIHETAGSGEVVEINLPDSIRDNYEIIKLSAITDSIFDWLQVYELAAAIFFIDSAHSNLVEQMNIGVNKHLKFRSSVYFTPVYKNNWTFI